MLFLILGVVLIIVGVRQKREAAHLAANGIRVLGHVTHLRESDLNGRSIFFPMVKFVHEQDGEMEVELSTGTSIQKPVGRTVELICDPADSDSIIESAKASWVPMLFIGVGALFAMIGSVSTFVKLTAWLISKI